MSLLCTGDDSETSPSVITPAVREARTVARSDSWRTSPSQSRGSASSGRVSHAAAAAAPSPAVQDAANGSIHQSLPSQVTLHIITICIRNDSSTHFLSFQGLLCRHVEMPFNPHSFPVSVKRGGIKRDCIWVQDPLTCIGRQAVVWVAGGCSRILRTRV